MKKIALLALLTAFALNVSAQVNAPKNTPQLEFAMQLRVTLGESFSINNTQHGRRTVIPSKRIRCDALQALFFLCTFAYHFKICNYGNRNSRCS